MPSLYTKTSGVWEPVIQPWIKTAGTWEPVLSIWVKNAGAWELVWTGFQVSTAPSTVQGYGDGSGTSQIVISDPTSVTITGGAGPFTYSWRQTSGDAMSVSGGGSSSSAQFFKTLDGGFNATATFVCDVTDTATGLVETTNTVTAQLFNP